MVDIPQPAEVAFAWDDRPGQNAEHVAEHGLSTGEWESIFHSAPDHDQDRDRERPESWVAEGRFRVRYYRISCALLEGTVVFPVLVYPITGFPISRRGLRRI
jgi:hypothetical protein